MKEKVKKLEEMEHRLAAKEKETVEEREKLERVFREKEQSMVKEQEGKLGKLREELRRLRDVNEKNEYKFLLKKDEIIKLVHIL